MLLKSYSPKITRSKCVKYQSQQIRCISNGSLNDPSALQVVSAPDLLQICEQLDKVLIQPEADVEKQALQLILDAKKQNILSAFGGARQLPKRIYTIDELRLNKIQPEKLLSPVDKSLNFVRNLAQAVAVAGLGAVAYFKGFTAVLYTLVGSTFLLVADQVTNMGGGEALIIDTIGRVINPSYAMRVAKHEAAHFLIAYLVGLLPRCYTLSSLDAYKRFGRLNIQAGCQFFDGAFQAEIATGRVSSSSLDKYMCVALAGVVAEYLNFEQAEGGVGDIRMLDDLLRALQFSQKKADGEVRWAVLNTVTLLRQYQDVHDALAGKMNSNASLGQCIYLIESKLQGREL